MSREKVLIVVVSLLVGAFFAGRALERRGQAPKPSEAVAKQPQTVAKAEPKPASPPPAQARAAHPARGPDGARVTIIEISDFECPFCANGRETVEKLRSEFPQDVQTIFINLPLSFHQQALPAAVAAFAAQKQGKFWPFYEQLFQSGKALSRKKYFEIAKQLKLDLGQFEADLGDDQLKERVLDDTAIAASLGITATPAYFINGVQVSGAQPLEKFKAVLVQQLKLADELLLDGVPRSKLHGRVWRRNNPARADTVMDWIIRNGVPPKSARPKPQKKPKRAAQKPKDKAKPVHPAKDKTVWKVALSGKEPSRGADRPLLSVVLYTDFQCPFCGRVRPTLKQLEKAYAGKMRLVFKNQPLDFHKLAPGAAEAALCAHQQGLFWQMEERLFERQSELQPAQLEAHAVAVGADRARFQRCMKQHQTRALVQADQKSARVVDVGGTPCVFINGRKISGAQPYSIYVQVMEQELKRAQAALAAGADAGALYKHLIKDGKELKPPEVLSSVQADLSLEGTASKVVKGEKLRVVAYIDFQCPYCARLLPNLLALPKAVGAPTSLHLKHLPLSSRCNPTMSRDMHPGACVIAQWVAAASLQNKGWDFALKLLQEARRVAGGDEGAIKQALEAIATDTGVDMQALRQRLSDGSAAAVVMEHIQETARLSLRGTPSVFFNGREYRGPLNLAAMERSAREAIASTKLSSKPAPKQAAKKAPQPAGAKPPVKTKPAPSPKPKAAPAAKVTSKPSSPQPSKPAAKAAPKVAPTKTP